MRPSRKELRFIEHKKAADGQAYESRSNSGYLSISVRQENAAPLIDDLEVWLHGQLPQISGKSAVAGAIRYGLTRLKRLRPYLDDGRLSIENNAAERGMRSIALRRKNYLFMGSDNAASPLPLPIR